MPTHEYQPRKSWRATINEQRRSIARLLDENPSLRLLLTDLSTICAAGLKHELV